MDQADRNLGNSTARQACVLMRKRKNNKHIESGVWEMPVAADGSLLGQQLESDSDGQ